MRRMIIVLLAVLALIPVSVAAGQDSLQNCTIAADEFMKSLTDNGYFLMPMSDLINLTENETVMSDWIILDIRPEDRYAAGHILGSMNIPFPDIVSKMEAVPSDKKLAVVCGFDTNSAIVVAMLRILGSRDAWIVGGGTHGWLASGGEFVT